MNKCCIVALSGLILGCSNPDGRGNGVQDSIAQKPGDSVASRAIGQEQSEETHSFVLFGQSMLAKVHSIDSSLVLASSNSVNDGDYGCISDELVRRLKVSDDLHGSMQSESALDSTEFIAIPVGMCSDNGEDVSRKAVYFRDSVVAEFDENCRNRLWAFSGVHFPYGTTPGQILGGALQKIPQSDLIAFVAMDGDIQHAGRIRTKQGTAYFDQEFQLLGWRYDNNYVCK